MGKYPTVFRAFVDRCATTRDVWMLHVWVRPTEGIGVGEVFTAWYLFIHDDVIKWKHFPSYWPFVRGIHQSPVNSPHKGQWRGALLFSLICAWTNGWVSNRHGCDLRRHRTHYDVTVMSAALVSGHGDNDVQTKENCLCFWVFLRYSSCFSCNSAAECWFIHLY